jgi:hypothetical protein
VVALICGALALLPSSVYQKDNSRLVTLPGGKTIKVRSFAVGTDREAASLRRSNADLLIVRIAAFTPNTAKLVSSLQKRKSGRRAVFLDVPLFSGNPSNGAFWNADWDADRDGKPDEDAPAWLKPREKNGWYPFDTHTGELQKVILGPAGLIAKVVRAGFDGMIVSAPGYSKNGSGIDVKLIADATIEGRKRREGFSVLLRNPGDLMRFPAIRHFLDGFVLDGLFYGKDRVNVRTDEEEVEEVMKEMEEAVEDRKIVLSLAYTSKPEQIRDNNRIAAKEGILTLALPRRF